MTIFRLVDTADSAEERGRTRAHGSPEKLDRDAIRAEIDIILTVAKDINSMEPDQAMVICSGYLARLTEIWVQIIRVEHIQRELSKVRTQEIAPTLELIRDQWKMASRMITVRGHDIELSR